MALSADALKAQGVALTNMLDSVGLTPNLLAKTFKDVGESPEKLRALLNLWFVPWVKPEFVPDRDFAATGFRDVEFLGTAEAPPAQLPFRMFDIETGNLVQYPAIGARGQYCMLSHRWKGVELTLDYIGEARKKGLERAREAAKGGAATHSHNRKSDVQLVLEQCKLDLEEQESLIRELASEAVSTELGGDTGIGSLLTRRLQARAAEDNLGWAKDSEHKARSKFRFAQMERKIFSSLVGQMREHVDEKLKDYLGTEGVDLPPGSDVGSEVVTEAEAELSKAEGKTQAAQEAHGKVQADVEYFQHHHHLRDALDEMVCRLQRWKSAIKVERAINRADHIFKNKLFQYREKCYLWTDTCCIDKKDAGELSQSLSLMGDWYSSAEYTLVQLDTPFNEADAVQDWGRFEHEKSGKQGPIPTAGGSKATIGSFGAIGKSELEWSTRAWTLQELVMSKTTFYANSEWTLLGRPVESLGYYYHTIPFISLYTRGDTHNIYSSSDAATEALSDVERLKGILADDDAATRLKALRENIQRSHAAGSAASEKSDGSKPVAEDTTARVERAQVLITLLESLGVQISSDLAMETATSDVARAVYLAATNLSGSHGGKETVKQRDTFQRLKNLLPPPDLTLLSPGLDAEEKDEEIAQHAINFLLYRLVAETEELVLADRKYVAKFGRVQLLRSWQQGTSRTGFSAQSVLEVGGKRRATVATDMSYALMGILGVRFPTFPAEGYAKALARLLDEVVITRNDISVFNWTGMELGSPVRGRSMYPASHTAYGNEGDRSRRYNLLLSARVQDKMDEVMTTYYSVIQTLRNAIELVKAKEHKSIPLKWIERIVQLVRLTGFRELKPHQDAFSKIVGYLKQHFRKEKEERERLERGKEARWAEKAEVAVSDDQKGTSYFQRPTLPSLKSIPSLPSSPFSRSASKPSSAEERKAETPEPSTKGGSRFGLGKSLKSPSFGLSKKSAAPVADAQSAEEQPTQPESPAPVQSPETMDVKTDPPPPYEDAQTKTETAQWQAVDREVMDYLSSPAAQRAKLSLPPDFQAITIESAESERPTTHSPSTLGFQHTDSDAISPNPIVVNNSGIQGLFDIQRVVVTMIDPDKLRRQIAKAASPHDKISGWCSVSTGFARIITSFACEKQVLEQELDVIESVEARVLREQDKDKHDKRAARLLGSLSVTKAAAEKIVKGGGTDVAEDAEVSAGSNEAGDDGTEAPDKKDTQKGNTDEERLVSRIIDFIQEPQLELIAGEWVLARFSSAPAANWFLCHLELGPGPGQFYGRRIAAGAIDFQDSTPEPGLVGAWQTYMDRKKRKMCYILDDYLRSRMAAQTGEERLKAGSDFAKQGYDIAAKGISGFGLGSPSLGGGGAAVGAEGKGFEGEDREEGDDDDGSASEEEDEEGDLLDKVLARGKLTARALGDYTVQAVLEKMHEMRADHLDKTLAAAVLKRTPKSLRSAVENMSDNKSFLPAMFHSATRVHMF